MTYTPDQLQAMRDWVAMNICRLARDTRAGQDAWVNEATGQWWEVRGAMPWAPDTDPSQMLMALDTFDDWAIAKIQPAGDYGCQIGDSSSELRARNKSLGLAALIAMCRASGMPE